MKKQRSIPVWAVMFCILALVVVLTVAGCQGGSTNPSMSDDDDDSGTTKTWTVMVYIAGDNNLADAGLFNIKQMEQVGSSSKVNIIVQYDKGYQTVSNVDWDGCRRFYITRDTTNSSSITSTAVSNLGTIDSGSQDELDKFISWGMSKYPAKKYAVVLWNHGSGAIYRGKPVKGICWDDETNNYLDQTEVRESMANAKTLNDGENIELVGMDACLMGMLEVAYDLAPSVNYFCGSVENVPGYGWNYEFLGELVDDPSMNGAQLGTQIVDYYEYFYTNVSPDTVTQAVMDLSKADTMAGYCKDFVDRLGEDAGGGQTIFESEQTVLSDAVDAPESYGDPSYKDLYAFADYVANNAGDGTLRTQAETIRDYVDDLVIYSYAHPGAYPGTHGVSMYLVNSSGSYNSTYETLNFDADTGWGSSFLSLFP